ncbi:MAG: hypothetical protein Q9197_003805, partial [Variospora fuerteventurae]
MEWFDFEPVPPSGTRLGRQLSRPSSASNSASVSAPPSPFTSYRNTARHPDSAVESIHPFSSKGSRRWSRQLVATPNTPPQRRYSQSNRAPYPKNSISPRLSRNKAGIYVRSRGSQERIVVPSDTPLHFRADLAIDIESPRMSSSGGPLTPSGRRSQTPSLTMTGVDLDPALTFSRRNSIANAGQMGTKQHRAARWFCTERAEVRKPKRISEWELDMVFLRWKAEDDDETLRSALPKVDPPLYDNIKDKMRQVAVELCLLRCRIAYSMQNWDDMEIRSQQAYNLAADLQWEPFKAKCALPLGVALYQQGKWEGAYENFLEALNTGDFYGPRSVIQKWIDLVTERRLRERALFITPLDSVVEEEEGFSFPRRQDRNLESRDPPSSHHSLQVAECSTRETALPRTSEAHSSSAPLKQVTQAVLTGVTRYTGNAADGSTTDRVLDGPAVITVSTDPNPASFGSPRLYNPKDGPAPSPPMRAATPPLRPALFLPRTLAASSLSEMELPPPFAQKVRKGDPSSEPGQGALLQDGPQEDDRQPLKPSSLLARKERSPQLSPSRQYSGRKSDVVPIQQSQALSPLEQADSEMIPPVSSLPSHLKTDELRNPSMVLEHFSFTSPFRATGSEAPPTTQ